MFERIMEMPVTLPDFSSSKCHFLRLCGEVEVDPTNFPPALRAQKEEEQRHVARYEMSGTATFIRFWWKVKKDAKQPHLHFDFAKEEYLAQRGQIPSVTIPIGDVERITAAASGANYQGIVEGYFGMSGAELPQLFRSFVKPRLEKGVRVSQTAGTYTVEGSPLKSIRWEKWGHKAGFLFSVRAAAPSPIGENVFITALKQVEGYLASLSAVKSGDVL